MVKTYSTYLPRQRVDIVKQYLQALQVKYSVHECDKLIYLECAIEADNNDTVYKINSFLYSLEVLEAKTKKNG